MATTTSMGICYICGAELGKTAMKNHLLKAHGGEDGGQECCLLKIEGAYDKDYWLLIDVPVEKPLSDIDSFLRKIWMECCWHMSAFRSPKRSEYIEIPESRPLFTFSVGDKVLYEYDFGSTTSALITVMGSTSRMKQRETVRLLARNRAPVFTCMECGSPAEYICTHCMYSFDNPFFCDGCGEKHEHDDMLLPAANSPRMGVCGYEGELDSFAYHPEKKSSGGKR